MEINSEKVNVSLLSEIIQSEVASMGENEVVYSTYDEDRRKYYEYQCNCDFDEQEAKFYNSSSHYNWEIDPHDSESDWENSSEELMSIS